MPSCIKIIDLKFEVSAEHGFTSLIDLYSEIAACNYATGFNDLQTSISAVVPYIDLKTDISVGFPVDNSGPYIIPETYPLDEQGGIGVYGPIFIVVEDLITGIDINSLELMVNSVVYTGDDSEVTFLPINAPYRYAIRYVPATPWALDSTVTCSIFIKDRAGNPGMGDLPL
jgi:hypothetical protein